MTEVVSADAPVTPEAAAAAVAAADAAVATGQAGVPASPPAEKDPTSPWNSLEVVKILVGVMIAVGAAASGFAVTGYFRDLDDLKARREAIQQLSKAILERRTRSSMLYESLKRQPDFPTEIPELKAELIQRKKDYDDAFVSWNVNLRGYYLTLRQAAQTGQKPASASASGAAPASSPPSPSGAASAASSLEAKGLAVFEDYFQGSLTNEVFRKIDTCLTSASTQYFRRENFRPVLEKCQMEAKLTKALNCGYALTEQLYLLTGNASTMAAAEAKIKGQCPPLDPEFQREP